MRQPACRFGVRVTADVAGGQGECGAVFDPPLDPSEREGFDFLMALDPLFILCFDLERTLHVTVTAVDGERLVLSVGEERPAQRIGPGQAPWNG